MRFETERRSLRLRRSYFAGSKDLYLQMRIKGGRELPGAVHREAVNALKAARFWDCSTEKIF